MGKFTDFVCSAMIWLIVVAIAVVDFTLGVMSVILMLGMLLF